MKAFSAALAVLLSAAPAAIAQQTVLVPWAHSWAVMHPMGQMPNIPAGGDVDFDTTWYLKQADFDVQYNGPLFGGNLTAVSTTPTSYDSRQTKGPIGYAASDYFTVSATNPSPEFTGFGDNDAVAPASGLLTTPASGSRRAVYFRTTFTVPAGGGALINPRFRYLIDDGAYVYLDGELIMAVNMAATTPANLDSYAATPEVVAAANGNEALLSTVSLGLAVGTATAINGVTVRTIKQVLALTEGEHTLALSVRNTATLVSSDITMALELSATNGCTIGATASNITRNNAGTPYNPGDDTFSFTATVTGFNAGNSWSSDDPTQPAGTMDTPVTFGPYPVSGGAKTLTFSSLTQPPCTAQVTATPPGGTLTASEVTTVRHTQGTLDPADDTFTAGVLVDGQFVSSGWRIVSTTPATAAGGSPAGGTTGAVSTFGPFPTASAPVTVVVADAANPAITATVALTPQAFIGSRTFGGVTTSFLSAAPLPAQWTATTGLSPVITLTGAGANTWREFRSPVFDLTGIGSVGFSMELVARETSTTTSNFENDDTFRAKLIVTDAGGTSEINLIAPYDTDANGMLNGALDANDLAADEFNLKREALSVALSNAFRFEAGIPASATSVQLVVEGANITAGSEFFDVRKISFSDQCGFSASVAGITRNWNGQPANPAAHTTEFTLRAVPTGAVSAAGWDVSFNRLGVPVTGASVTSGAWNTNVLVTGLPADGGAITAIIRDKGDSTCLAALSILPPAAPGPIGTFARGAVTSSVYSNGPATGWTAITGGSQMTQAAAIGDFTTLPVNLAGISGTVEFSMTLEAEETSTGSNFESTDTFYAELLLTDDTGAETTVNLVEALDLKAPAGINGGPATYVAADDEFNKNAEPVTALLNNSWVLAHTIPDNIVTARLHVTARVDATTEFLRMKNVLWAAPAAPGNTDSDGDGATDAQEAQAGTNPNNPASVFRVATLTAAGNTVTAAFPTVSGKFYRGYTSTNLLTWTRDDSAAAVPGDGAAASWNFGITAGVPAKYYRMAVAGSADGFPATLP